MVSKTIVTWIKTLYKLCSLEKLLSMILFKILNDNIASVEADRAYCNLSEILCNIASSDYWKGLFPEEVSLGCTLVDNVEIHYLKREAYATILLHLYHIGYNVTCKHAEDGETAPIAVFEPWNPPGNQECAMATGYDSVPIDYTFIQNKYYTKPGTNGWRQYPPVI